MSVRKKILQQIDPETGASQEATWWIADYADGNGRRRQVRFKHKRDAVAHEEKSKVAVRDGKYLVVADVTMADAARIWLNRVEANGMRHRGPVERTTLLQYREHVDLHILPRIGKAKLPKLTRHAVEGFRDALLKDDAMSRAMARKVLVSLKSMLKANNCGHLADDVTIGMDARSKHHLEIGRDIPTPSEIGRLIAAAAPDARLHALLRVAALCGLRASELRGLRWSDVDLKAEELHVRQRADRYCVIGAPKTKESRRTIPLSPETVLALKAWKLACPKGERRSRFPVLLLARSSTMRTCCAAWRRSCAPPAWFIGKRASRNMPCTPSDTSSPPGASIPRRAAAVSCRPRSRKRCSVIPRSL